MNPLGQAWPQQKEAQHRSVVQPDSGHKSLTVSGLGMEGPGQATLQQKESQHCSTVHSPSSHGVIAASLIGMNPFGHSMELHMRTAVGNLPSMRMNNMVTEAVARIKRCAPNTFMNRDPANVHMQICRVYVSV